MLLRVLLVVGAGLVGAEQLQAQCPCHQRSRGISLQIWNDRGPFRGTYGAAGPRDYGYAPCNTFDSVAGYSAPRLRPDWAPRVTVEVFNSLPPEQGYFQGPREFRVPEFGYGPQRFAQPGGACPNGLCPLR